MRGKNKTIILLRGQAWNELDAQQIAAGLLMLEECIDVCVWASWLIDAYLIMEGITRSTLPEGCSFIQAPRYVPGELATLTHYFPGAVSGSQVRIIHLCYIRSGYRYFVSDEQTKARGWIDAEHLETL